MRGVILVLVFILVLPEAVSPLQVELLRSTPHQILVRVKIKEYQIKSQNYQGEKYHTITLGNFLHLRWLENPGQPRLPKPFCRLGIPLGVEPKARVVAKSLLEKLSGCNLLPNPQEKSKSRDDKFYSKDILFPQQLIHISKPKFLRAQRFIELEFSPIQFNPTRREVYIWEEIIAEVTFSGCPAPSSFSHQSSFEEIYSSLLLNSSSARAWRVPELAQEEEIKPKYLIISNPTLWVGIPPGPLADTPAWRQTPLWPFIGLRDAELGDYRGDFQVVVNLEICYQMSQEIAQGREVEEAFKECHEKLKRFIAREKPKYVLLIGAPEFVPTHYRGYADGEGLYSPIDEPYVRFSGNDLLPDAALGRLSVRNIHELRIVLDKIIRYETLPEYGQWAREVLLVADDDEKFGSTSVGDRDPWKTCNKIAYSCWEIGSQRLRYLPSPYYKPFFIFVKDLPRLQPVKATEHAHFRVSESGVVPSLLQAWDDGKFIIYYTGHGGTVQWADEMVFRSVPHPSLWPRYVHNQGRLPIVICATCYNGMFHWNSPHWVKFLENRVEEERKTSEPNEEKIKHIESVIDKVKKGGVECVAERLVNAHQKGAIAVIAATRTSNNSVGDELGRFFFFYLFYFKNSDGQYTLWTERPPEEPLRLGDLFLKVKAEIMSEDYSLFGDPGLKIRDLAPPYIEVKAKNKLIPQNYYLSGSQPQKLKVRIYDESGVKEVKILTNSTEAVPQVNLAHRPRQVNFLWQVKPTHNEYQMKILARDSSRWGSSSSVFSLNVSSLFEIKGVLNFPNPFPEKTTFRYELSREAEEVIIRIWSLTGKLVQELKVSRESRESKCNLVTWDGRDRRGEIVDNGIYLYQIIAKSGAEKIKSPFQKMVILRCGE
jgi:hypothetical protein